MLPLWKKSYEQTRQHIKKLRHYFADKGLSNQSYGFPSSHMSWTIKKAEHRRIDAFELWCWRRPLRVPWTAKRSNQSILRKQSWRFIGRTNVEAETPILWSLDGKNWLIGKDPDAGKDKRQEEKGTTKGQIVEWYHCLDDHEFEQALGVGDGQRGLVCCSPWDCK